MIPVGSTVFALHYRKVMKPVIIAWNKIKITSGELVENTQESNGSIAALFLIFLFSLWYFGSILLAAWAVSVTMGTGYWMTALSITLLKFALN